jgi:hypothetical protein
MKDFNQSILAMAEVKEIFSLFGRYGVRYLIFGGCAVMLYSGARYTRNIDIWTDRSAGNAKSVYDVLKAYGAPLACLSPDDFSQQGFFYHMGCPPLRIDDMPNIHGLSFNEAWNERESMFIDGVRYFFISRKHLIAAKMATGRPQDIVDVRRLVESMYASKRLH